VRVTEIAVRRLKSFGDFSNIAVELRAALAPSDDVEKVFEALLTKIEELIELGRDLEYAAALSQEIEKKRKELRSEVEALEKTLDEYMAAVEELKKVRDVLSKELEEARELLRRRGSVLDRIRNLVTRGG